MRCIISSITKLSDCSEINLNIGSVVEIEPKYLNINKPLVLCEDNGWYHMLFDIQEIRITKEQYVILFKNMQICLTIT